MIQTGFIVRPNFAPIPFTTDGSKSGHSYNPGHGMLITAVEQNLRSTIKSKMMSTYGASWIQLRISSNLKKEWQDKMELATVHSKSPLSLLNYSIFMDLKDIIVNRQHWSEAFKNVFHNKAQFISAMKRLRSVR